MDQDSHCPESHLIHWLYFLVDGISIVVWGMIIQSATLILHSEYKVNKL